MSAEEITLYFVFPVCAYLLGSVPFAFVIGKAHGVDIRTVGSRNVGATNLGRTLGKRYFWQAFLLDALKSFVPTLVASVLVNHWNAISSAPWGTFYPQAVSGPLLPSWTPLLSGVAAVLGHLFPVYLRFKGGKGVSTGFGAVLGFWPIFTLAGVFGALVFVGVVLVHRFISLASLVGAVAFSGAATVLALNNVVPGVYTYRAAGDRVVVLTAAWLFTVMIVLRHRGNIKRLLNGTEPTVGRKEVEKAKLK